MQIIVDKIKLLWYNSSSKQYIARGRSSAGRALEWHSRGHRFDPDRLHQSLKALFIAVFRLFLISKSHILLFFFKIIIVIFKPFYCKMSVSMSVRYFKKSWILSYSKIFLNNFLKNFKKTIFSTNKKFPDLSITIDRGC